VADTNQQSEADRTGKMEAMPEPPPSESSLELENDDILEVDGVLSHPPSVVVAPDASADDDGRSEAPADRTLPMKRSDVMAAAAKAADLQELDYELPQVTKIIPPTPAPPKTSPVLTTTKAMPGQNVIVAPSHHPPSVAPVSLDRAPLDRTPTTALQIPPPPMKSPAVPIVVGGVLLAAILGIAGAAAGFALGSEPEKSASPAPSASTTTEAPATVAAASPSPSPVRPQAAPSPDPVTAPPPPVAAQPTSEGTVAQPAPTLDNLPSSDVTSLPSAPAKNATPPQPHAFVAAPEPPPRPAAAPPKPSAPPAKTAQAAAAPPPPPAAPAPQSTTGVVRVPISDSIVTIVVDGHFRRVNNGAVIVSCGPHSVRVGSNMAKDVNVPCGGSVSVD
jgi:hypothetical protein